MLKFVISFTFFFFAVGVVFCQSDVDDSDVDPINNRHSIQGLQKSCAFPCPRGWTYFSAHGICLLVTPSLPWNAAERFCVKLGGHLMSVHARKSLDIAHDITKENEIWIGLNRMNNDDVWNYSNNATVNYLPWYNTGTSKCARIAGNSFLQEHGCEVAHFGICQIYAFA